MNLRALPARVITLAFLWVATASHAAAPPVYQVALDSVIWRADQQQPLVVDALAEPPLARVQALIQQSRIQGDLRPLGRAQALLDSLPRSQRDTEFAVLKATIAQRLHEFDRARKLLLNVLTTEPGHAQANFTLYSIALVEGDYDLADRSCAATKWHWIATSCRFNLMGLQGQEQAAFEGLRAALEDDKTSDRRGYDWALATLAELAAAIDHPDSERHFRRALLTNPDDHYIAAEFADWLLRQRRADTALAVLDSRPDSDRLALLRTLAYQQLDDSRAETLAADLRERFARARRRGDDIHLHERARFELDVEGRPDIALRLARDNIAQQRERADWRLLRRAEAAAGED